jgi:hypothetical protein
MRFLLGKLERASAIQETEQLCEELNRSSFKTVSEMGAVPILLRGLRKIGTVPDGFETAFSLSVP